MNTNPNQQPGRHTRGFSQIVDGLEQSLALINASVEEMQPFRANPEEWLKLNEVSARLQASARLIGGMLKDGHNPGEPKVDPLGDSRGWMSVCQLIGGGETDGDALCAARCMSDFVGSVMDGFPGDERMQFTREGETAEKARRAGLTLATC